MTCTKRYIFEPCHLECIIYLSQAHINLKRTSNRKKVKCSGNCYALGRTFGGSKESNPCFVSL